MQNEMIHTDKENIQFIIIIAHCLSPVASAVLAFSCPAQTEQDGGKCRVLLRSRGVCQYAELNMPNIYLNSCISNQFIIEHMLDW